VGIDPTCQLGIAVGIDERIGTGRQDCDKEICDLLFPAFRFYVGKGLPSPVYLDFFSSLVLDMHGNVVVLLKITVPLAKLSIHDAVRVPFFVFFP